MIEITNRIFRKILIQFHKYINFGLYKNGVKLYGIPKLVMRNNIKLERGVRINEHVFIHGAGGVVIDENVTLSYGVTILSTGYDVQNWELNKIEKKHKDDKVQIGKNVWICANVTILPGVTIQEDVIIAAGSVVTKDIKEPGYVYGGIPAKKIKKINEVN